MRQTVVCALVVVLASVAAAPAVAAAATDRDMSWSVLSRFGGDADGDGRLDAPGPEAPAELNLYPVVVRPSSSVCDAFEAARWFVDGAPHTPAGQPQPWRGRCQVIQQVRGEGKHSVKVRLGDASEVAEVRIDDRLVVALGDSVASGEGNPDETGGWLDKPCHRSATAGFEQASRLLAGGKGDVSITFVSLACSGAAVQEGLLDSYDGVAPKAGAPPYAPQVERLERLASARGTSTPPAPAVDAVLLSVGANDVHFSQIVKACALPGDCRDRYDAQVFGELNVLARRYQAFAGALADAAPGSPVLITEYFDPTRDEQGRFCRWSVGLTSGSEARWAHEDLLRPLNAEVFAAAVRYDWLRVGGIATDFQSHGYCAGAADRWVRRLAGSLYSQSDASGTLHPNELGHTAVAARVLGPLSNVLGVSVPPEEEAGDSGRPLWKSIARDLGVVLAALFALAALALLVRVLIGSPLRDWPLLLLIWLGSVIAVVLAAVLGLLGVVIALVGFTIARLWRLVRPTDRPDPCDETAGRPELRSPSRTAAPGQLLIVLGALVVLLVLLVLFAGVVGSAILWVRFWSVHLPADQAVDAVSRGAVVATGTQALAIFAILGAIAVVAVWMIDGKGQWARATRRGLVAIVVAELLVAILLGDLPTRQAVELFAGFVLAALLVHFLVDRALAMDSMLRSKEPLGRVLLKRLRPLVGLIEGNALLARVARFAWRLLPLLLLALAVHRSFTAHETDRVVFVIAPLLLAAILFVSPGGIAHSATAPEAVGDLLDELEPARIALAFTSLVCMAVLLVRDEAWLAGAAGVGALLALACLTVARASGPRFAPFGIAVLISVPLFGATAVILRGVDSPEVQPVAVTLTGGKPVCGIYIGESDGQLWLGRVELPEEGTVRRPEASGSRIFPVASDKVAQRSVGPLQPVARAEDQAVALRDELLSDQGHLDLKHYEPTCEPPKPTETVRASWQRSLAERYQPELVVDREDGFWPIPVTTLFSMQDRRATACRLVTADAHGDCVRLTTPGEFPWAGGQGEAIEYPAANVKVRDQHDLMTDALGTLDPAQSAREYFLVAGQRSDDLPDTLQYWFFYPFNYQPVNALGGINTAGFHEGDFESIHILLSARTHRPRYIWMARHDAGRAFAWEDTAVDKLDDHPRVFVARGSHASYENCQRQERYDAPAGLIDDRPTCEESLPMHLVPEATPLTDLSRVGWGCWQGRFGHRRAGEGYEKVPYLVNDAPQSPLWQQDYAGPDAEPCRGVDDPGDREGFGEEVLEEREGTPATLRRGAGHLDPLVDECSDWELAPAGGTYMVACDQAALRAYIESGLEDPGPAGVRIDDADLESPDVGQISVPAVRQAADGIYLDAWRITAATRTRVSVFASCRDGDRMIAVRFPSVVVDPEWPLHVSDRDPAGWRLQRDDGSTVARAVPFKVRGDATEEGERFACGGA